MIKFMLILASASPRRKELLTQINCKFTARPSNAPELSFKDEPNPEKLVMENAKLKATASVLPQNKDEIVLGFDTLVYHNGKIFGKPKDDEEAFAMLKNLSGDTHQVYTGVALIYKDKIYQDFAKTDVTMQNLTDGEIWRYIKTGEPKGKAGAYAIQGIASVFITKIMGCYSNVVGLPLNCLYNLAKKADINLWEQ